MVRFPLGWILWYILLASCSHDRPSQGWAISLCRLMRKETTHYIIDRGVRRLFVMRDEKEHLSPPVPSGRRG